MGGFLQDWKARLSLRSQNENAAGHNGLIDVVSEQEIGLFVYRLGRKIFILERGVRLPYGLPITIQIKREKIDTDNDGKSQIISQEDTSDKNTLRTESLWCQNDA